MDFSFIILQFLTGLAYASSLFLLAVGLSLIFGALGIVNFAHGSFYMLGAYLLYWVVRGNPEGLWWGLVVVAALGFVIGAATERLLLRPVYNRPEHYQILLTYALLLVIEDGVKLLFGSAYKSLGPPAALAYPVWIFGAPFPAYYFVQIGLALLVAGGLWFFLQRTRSGTLVRAATQDREMLEALGVNVPRLLTVVFALGIALATLGGAATLPMQTVSPGIAVEAVISAFIVVVVGGLGSVWGALLGAFLIGEIQAFGVLVLPEFAIAFVYLLMVVVLLVRPWGLLGRPPAVRT